jgi:hypothetical protein
MNSKITDMKQKKHKWVDNHNSDASHKNQHCTKCNWGRQWIGGRWQMWEYYKDGIETFKRPQCE